jgi:hypothetical protein
MSEIIQRIKSIHWNQIFIMMLIAAVVVGSDGCKSTGKLTKKERKAQIEAAKKELNAIISGTSTKTLDQQEKYINDISNKNYNDPDLNALLVQATQVVKKAFAEKEAQRQKQIAEAKAALFDLLQNKDNKSADEMETELNQIKNKYKGLNDEEVNDLYARVEKQIAGMRSTGGNIPLKTTLENNFQGIADAGKAGNASQAAALMQKTLPLFASEDAPVLIIISKEGSIIDYDKPTTIKRYLNFLNDQKVNRNSVDSYQLDNNGKIKELDLIKK